MADLETRFAEVMQDDRVGGVGARLLVGVSGGVDSMVLLHLLRGVLGGDTEVGVVHVNHGLRGAAAAADERLVRGFAAKLEFGFLVHSPPVKRIAQAEGISLEMAAREARHRAFVASAQEWNCETVALAHHRDDQIELFLLRLLRGAGAAGLGGMAMRSPSAFSKDLTLIRPMLDFDRAEIVSYARRRRVPFREDASNQDERIPRNRLRKRIVPLLREMQPALGEVMGRSMKLLRAEDAATAGAADLWLQGHSQESFGTLPLALRRHVVRQQLFDRGVVPDFDLVETLIEEPGMVVNGPDGSRWELTAAGEVQEAPIDAGEFLDAKLDLKIADVPLNARFEGGEYDLRFVSRPIRLGVKTVASCEYFDADRLGGGVVLRHWQPGDRYRPIGMHGTVKLQDMFVNAGVPREERRTRVLLANRKGEIIWVEGQRIGECAKVLPTTKSILRWMWRRGGRGVVGRAR